MVARHWSALSGHVKGYKWGIEMKLCFFIFTTCISLEMGGRGGGANPC